MKALLRQLVTAFAQGLLILALALGLPVTAVKLFAQSPAPSTTKDFETSHATAVENDRGLVLKLKEQRCGCPEPNDKTIDWSRWPTRCRPKNATLTPDNFRPFWSEDPAVNSIYPKIYYPKDAPPRIVYNGNKTIPFPGWPLKRFSGKIKDDQTPWTRDHSAAYRKIYKKEWGGTPPGSKKFKNPVEDHHLVVAKPPRTTWHYWQIHHVLERHYGGTNEPMNLVPVYSRPNRLNPGFRSNLHNEFTQWWAKIRVDSDCRRLKKDVWPKIQDCRAQAVVWPKK